jgi:hypothetical protein
MKITVFIITTNITYQGQMITNFLSNSSISPSSNGPPGDFYNR